MILYFLKFFFITSAHARELVHVRKICNINLNCMIKSLLDRAINIAISYVHVRVHCAKVSLYLQLDHMQNLT